MVSIFVQEVPRINLTKFWHGYHCYNCNYAKHINMAYSFSISKNAFKMFPKPKTRVMVGYYISQAFNPYLVHIFLNCVFAPNIWTTNCSIIGIILPLIKVQIKPFQISKKMLWSASKLNKLSNHINFTFFWNVLVPHLIILLHV